MKCKLRGTVVLLLLYCEATKAQKPASCSTPICVSESSRLVQQIDPRVNPCDDFYQFSCGKYFKSFKSGQERNPYKALAEKAEKRILELYNEPSKASDHVMVKAAKTLYRACMNTAAIEENSLRIMKEVLKAVGGGWPLVEGSNWNPANFNWVQATYKLRELGFPFAVFLDVKVDGDPRNKSNSLLQVKIPFKLDEGLDMLSEKNNAIVNIAKLFGAEMVGKEQELKDMYEFGEQLRRQILQHRGLISYPVYKVIAVQEGFRTINWLEFINTLTSPAVQLTSNDYVIVVEQNSIRERLEVISRATKRIQANYLMWKVVEHMAPFLTSNISKYILEDEQLKESRTSFCLSSIEEKFTPNPINILYTREQLPQNKRQKIEEMVLKIRDELLEGVDKVTWLSRTDKANVLDKAQNIIAIVGESGNYYDDKILDELNVDMKTVNDGNFLNLLAQANRNFVSFMYSKINKPKLQNAFDKWYMKPSGFNILYEPKDNILRLPTSQLQNEVFDINKPNYLNYGALGKRIGEQISKVMGISSSYYDKYGNDIDGWTRKTTAAFQQQSDCLIRTMDRFTPLIFDIKLFEMQANVVGSKLAYGTYKNWAKTHGSEQKLVNLNYTPNQLYWISSVLCYPEDDSTAAPRQQLDFRNFSKFATYAAVRNNPDFAKDFNCPEETVMNPPLKCHLF